MAKLMPAAVNRTNDSGKLDGPEIELTSAPFLNATEPAHKDKTGFTHPCCSKSHADDLHIKLDPARQLASAPQEISAERFDDMVMSASHCPTKENVDGARDRLDREGPFYAVVCGSYPGVYQGKHMAAAACYPVSNKWTVYSSRMLGNTLKYANDRNLVQIRAITHPSHNWEGIPHAG
jgi:hypothetical protein